MVFPTLNGGELLVSEVSIYWFDHFGIQFGVDECWALKYEATIGLSLHARTYQVEGVEFTKQCYKDNTLCSCKKKTFYSTSEKDDARGESNPSVVGT